MNVGAISCTPHALDVLGRDVAPARHLGRGYLDVGGDVLGVISPGGLRSPLSIEVPPAAWWAFDADQPVVVGAGSLRYGSVNVGSGPRWDPRPPRVDYVPVARCVVDLDLDEMVGVGPGLTPLGDDVWCGAVAGMALFGRPCRAVRVPDVGATTSVSRGLMARALRGELPEPAHRILADGHPGPLLRWGATSGTGVIYGLAVAAATLLPRDALGGVVTSCCVDIDLPGIPRRVVIDMVRLTHPGEPRRGPDALVDAKATRRRETP